MKYLAVLVLNYFVVHPNNKVKWILFAITYLATIVLLYSTESIEYWWFKWIVIPLLYVLIVLALQFIVKLVYYQILAFRYVKLREEMSGINFTIIPPNERNRTIERFLNDRCMGDDGEYKRPINSLVRFMNQAPKEQHAAYYNAAAYYFLYVKKDYEAADSCALSCLKLLSCINKNYLIGPYKWIGNKFVILFDNEGFVKINNQTIDLPLSYFEEIDPNAPENPLDSLKFRRN